MSYPADCPACIAGDHNGHDAAHGTRQGLIGGNYCACTGDCAERAAAAFAKAFPVTASDARPPSDTGTTGWAIDPSGNIHRQGGGCYSTHCRPVLVVDPAAAHEPLADLIAHHDAYRVNDDGWVVCICGNVAEGDDDDGSHARHVTELILAALAGQGQP